MKEWRMTESDRCNVSPSAIANRVSRGRYRGKISIVRRNARVVFVIEKKPIPLIERNQRGTKKMNQPTGIEGLVCADIVERQKKGNAKYGVTVEQNPLPLAAWLQHAYEECLDQAVYLRRAIEEQKNSSPPT